MAKKFSELDRFLRTAINDDDILASTDVSEIASKKVVFSDFKDYVANDLFGDGFLAANTIIEQINVYLEAANTEAGDVVLNSATLGGESPEYYLEYSNFANTPFIATDLAELDDTGNYLTFNPTLGRIENKTIVNGNVTNTTRIDADDIPAGTTNQYYTTEKFLTDLNQNIQSVLDQQSTLFFDGNLNSSVVKCSARFSNFTGATSNTLSQVQFIDNFTEGQVVRIYGGNLDNSTLIDSAKSFVITSVVANQFDGTGATTHTLSYKIAEMDLTNGNISSAGNAVDVVVASREIDGSISELPILQQMNDIYNISINISGSSNDKAILIYRKVTSAIEGSYKLYQVIGPKDHADGLYIDYGTYDHNSWSPKASFDNTYVDSIHVPLTPPASPIRGWCDATISQVDYAQDQIRLNTFVYADPSSNVNVSNNDTSKIQNAINEFKNEGRGAIQLNDKTYVVDTLALPNDFTLKGTPSISTLAKLPWSGYHGSSGSHNNIITPAIGSEKMTRTSIVDIDILGNAEYSVLFPDTTTSTKYKNYAVFAGNDSEEVYFGALRIFDAVGGGFWADGAIDMRINICAAKDHGVTDRHEYSPLYAPTGQAYLITNNRFQNYPAAVDISVTTKGLFTNNVVDNCGSGVLVYGSRFLISSPNVLVGPANEFLPKPDILNSVYDSVNIELVADQQYQSDVYRYQENGVNYDLTGDNGVLTHHIYKLEQLSDGSEVLYEELPTGFIQPVYGISILGQEGLFRFTISREKVAELQDDYGTATLKAARETHVGLVYATRLTTEVESGVIGNTSLTAETNQYEVIVSDYENLSVGTQVVLRNHIGFSTGTGISLIGTILSVTPSTNNATVVIEYDEAASLTKGSNGTGNIRVVNTKTLVKGRIM